jgi:hypothetical protein
MRDFFLAGVLTSPKRARANIEQCPFKVANTAALTYGNTRGVRADLAAEVRP